MAVLRIPDQYRPGLVVIKTLSDDSVDLVVSLLRQTPPTALPRALGSASANRPLDLTDTQLENLGKTLVSLYGLKANRGLAAEALVDELSTAMAANTDPGLRLSEEDRVRFKQVLTRLLSVDTFAAKLKEVDLSLEYERTFCNARVLTDIRPVFGSDPLQPPVGAVIVHTLRISYHEGNQVKQIFIAMDGEDISTLRDALHRAELKARSLDAVLETSRIRRPEGE